MEQTIYYLNRYLLHRTIFTPEKSELENEISLEFIPLNLIVQYNKFKKLKLYFLAIKRVKILSHSYQNSSNNWYRIFFAEYQRTQLNCISNHRISCRTCSNHSKSFSEGNYAYKVPDINWLTPLKTLWNLWNCSTIYKPQNCTFQLFTAKIRYTARLDIEGRQRNKTWKKTNSWQMSLHNTSYTHTITLRKMESFPTNLISRIRNLQVTSSTISWTSSFVLL